MKDTVDELDKVAKIKPNVTITLVVHDEMSGSAIIEVKLQESKPSMSLESLIDTYVEDSEWIKANHGICHIWRFNRRGAYQENIMMYYLFVI